MEEYHTKGSFVMTTLITTGETKIFFKFYRIVFISELFVIKLYSVSIEGNNNNK